MRYYEIDDPYYSLIRAEDIDGATTLYIDQVAGNEEEREELIENMKEVSREHAMNLYAKGQFEDKEDGMITSKEVEEEFRNPTDSKLLLIDGSLL